MRLEDLKNDYPELVGALSEPDEIVGDFGSDLLGGLTAIVNHPVAKGIVGGLVSVVGTPVAGAGVVAAMEVGGRLLSVANNEVQQANARAAINKAKTPVQRIKAKQNFVNLNTASTQAKLAIKKMIEAKKAGNPVAKRAVASLKLASKVIGKRTKLNRSIFQSSASSKALSGLAAKMKASNISSGYFVAKNGVIWKV